MYATNRLLGFESLTASFFGAQSPQVPVKPTSEVQKLLDAAAKLPKADQLSGYEKALDAAIASKDPAGARFAARELRNVLIALKRTNEVEPYLLGLQKRAQQAMFPLMEAHVLVNLALTYEAAKQIYKTISAYEAAGKLFETGGDKAGQSRALGNLASTLSDTGQSKDAVSVFERALSLARDSGDQPQAANVLSLSAANLKFLNRTDDALARYEEALLIYRAIGEQSAASSVLNAIAVVYVQRGELEKALPRYIDALAYFRSMGEQVNVSNILKKVAVIYTYLGDIDSALSIHEECLAIKRAIGDKLGTADILVDIGNIHFNRGNFEKSLGEFEEALSVHRELGNKSGIASCLNNIAVIHTRDDFVKALALSEEALSLQRSLDDKFGIAMTLNNIANMHETRGAIDKALALHEESLSIRQNIGDQSGIAMSLNNIAKIHRNRGNLIKALSIHKQALDIRRSRGDIGGVANSLVDIAAISAERGDQNNALTSLTESLAIFRNLGDKSGIASTLTAISLIYFELGDLDKARALSEESLVIHRELGEVLGIASGLNNIANICLNRGDTTEALALHEEALALHESIGDMSAIASSQSNMGVIYNKTGFLDKALTLYNQSLVINRSLENKLGIAMNLNNIAGIYYQLGEIDSALSFVDSSLHLEREVGHKAGIATSLNVIAHIYINLGKYREALVALDESLVLYKATGLKEMHAYNCHLRALLMSQLGQVELASVFRAEAASLYIELNNPTGKSDVLIEEGVALLTSGKPSLALAALSRGRELRIASHTSILGVDYLIGEAHFAAKHNVIGELMLVPALEKCRQSGYGNSRALTTLGRAYLANRKPTIAAEALRYALTSSVVDRDPEYVSRAFSALADHALAMKDRDVAIIHLKRAIEARQVQRRGSIGLDDAMTASLSLKVAPDYRKLAGLLTDSGRLGEAMEVAELLKRSEAKVRGGDIASETPADQGKAGAAEAAYRKAAEDLGKLGDRERFLSKVKYPSNNVKAEIAAMPAKLKVANKALTDALNRVIAQEKAAGSAAGRMRDTGAAQARLAATLKRLGPGYAAVTVLCLPDSIRFLISTPNSLTMKRVTVAEKTLVGQVKVLRDSLLDPTSDPLPSAKALHTVLWAPIESELKRLGVKHVLLSLTGTARYVPFGALHNGTQYVAQGWGLSLYSPTVLEHIGDRTAKQWSVLAAGNSTERTVDDGIGSKLRFTSLPGVRAELSRVRQSVGAGPAPILDNEFTLATLKDGLTKQPSVVHLASHFQFDPRAESLSFLLTGQGEVLRASDTTVLTKDAFKGVDLLTLSACQTGTFSETADGMEVEGIASLMQRKGAGAVMSTLWPVADASTAAFMGTFYTLRAQDPRRTKAWCLREAQLRMIRGEVAPPGAPKPVATRGTTSIKVSTKGLRKDWSHPYHWAPFILQGNPL